MITTIVLISFGHRILGRWFSGVAGYPAAWQYATYQQVKGLFWGYKQVIERPHKNERIKNHSEENIQSSLSLPQASISLLSKLILRNTLAHRTSTAHTTTDHLQQLIRVICTTPLLVRNNLHALLHLGFLHNFAVGAHSALRIRGSKRVGDQSRRVQAGERDELPAVTHRGEALDVGFLVGGLHGGLPVEGGGEVVGESGNIY